MNSYNIKDIVPELKHNVDYYLGIFEDTPDPDLGWPHRHNFFSLIWFTDGSGINVIDFEEYEIVPVDFPLADLVASNLAKKSSSFVPKGSHLWKRVLLLCKTLFYLS